MCATETDSVLLEGRSPMLLTIHFPPPGFFLADMRVAIRVDGELRHQGSFTRGFRVMLDLEPGAHTVETAIGDGLLQRKRSYFVELPAEGDGIVATLGYSRMWGNFEPKLAISDMGLVPMPVDAREAEEPEPPSVPVRATWIVVAVLAALFALEYALPVSPREGLSPSVLTLDALGGLGATALRDGDFFRILTCTLLHADPVHLGLNALSLVLAGILVERKTGPFWFFVVYTASAIGGSFMSLALNKGNIISIGASGAILGIFAAGMVLAGAYPVEHRGGLRLQLARVLVPSLLPIFQMHGGEQVDFGAHLGGALVGAVMGYTLLGPLKKSALRGGGAEPFATRGLGKVLAGLALLATVVAASRVAVKSYPVAREMGIIAATLIPDAEFPIKGPPTDAQREEWRTKYPNDPRVLAHSAGKALEAHDRDAFERAIREGREAVKRTAPAVPKETVELFTKDFDALEGDRGLLDLVPNASMPQGTGDALVRAWEAKLPELLTKYPNDPRVHIHAAFRAFDASDYKGTIDEVRLARAKAPPVEKFFPKGLDLRSLSGLELVALDALGRGAEAAPLRTRVCEGAEGDSAKKIADGVCKGAPR